MDLGMRMSGSWALVVISISLETSKRPDMGASPKTGRILKKWQNRKEVTMEC